MKKYLFILVLGIFCLFNINVNASTVTYPRTEQNLLLPSWVDSSKLDINKVLSTPAVDPKEKIYDYADLVTDGDELKLYSYAKEYLDHTTYDLAIVTTDNINNLSPYEYMYNFYDYNSFERNGLILLVYKKDGKNNIYIGTTSYGKSEIDNIYTKAYIKGMIDHLKNIFNSDNDYQGFNDFIKLSIGIYDIQTNGSGNYRVNANGELVKNIYYFDYLVIAFAITSVVVILLVYFNNNCSNKIVTKDYLNKQTVIVKKISDERIE